MGPDASGHLLNQSARSAVVPFPYEKLEQTLDPM